MIPYKSSSYPEALLTAIFEFPGCIITPEKQKETFDKIRDGIRGLSPLQQKLIKLHLYEGLRIKNISIKLSLSESYIRSRLNQALHHLRMTGNYKYSQMLERSRHI